GARYRDLADLDRGAERLPRRPVDSRQGLCLSRPERRQALELQERADRLRAVPARRSPRPPAEDLLRAPPAALRGQAAGLHAGADDPAAEGDTDPQVPVTQAKPETPM